MPLTQSMLGEFLEDLAEEFVLKQRTKVIHHFLTKIGCTVNMKTVEKVVNLGVRYWVEVLCSYRKTEQEKYLLMLLKRIKAATKSTFFITKWFVRKVLLTAVISRGAQGGGAPLLKLFIILGCSVPLKILALALLSKVYWHCFQSIFYCYAQLCITKWLLRHL